MHAKFPENTWPIWLITMFIAVVLVGLCRLSRWCYLLSVPVVLILIYNAWGTLSNNVSFREAMIQQLGYDYFVQYACSFSVPIITLAVFAFYDFRYSGKRPERF